MYGRHDSYIKLVGIANFIEQQSSLDESLNELAAMAANILNVQNSSIMLFQTGEAENDISLRLFAKFGPLPSNAFHEAEKFTEGIAGQVASSGQPIMVTDITVSPYLLMARRPEGRSKCFIAVPILIRNTVIGVMNFSNPENERSFDHGDLSMACFVALLVGKSIHVNQLQNILKSKFVQLSIAQETGEGKTQSISLANLDPGKMAKMVAKTFFREMKTAGFEPKHIVNAATELIANLNETLAKHKTRMDSDKPA